MMFGVITEERSRVKCECRSCGFARNVRAVQACNLGALNLPPRVCVELNGAAAVGEDALARLTGEVLLEELSRGNRAH